MESVRPRLPVHADAGLVAARIAETPIERQGTRLRIEVHNEQAVFAVFARVQNDATAVRIGRDPVRLLLLIECDPRHLAYVG